MSSGMTHTAPRKTWWYLTKKYPNTFFGLSYGVIDIEWNESIPILTMVKRNGMKDIHRTKVIWKDNTWSYLIKSTGTVTDPGAPSDEEHRTIK